MYLSPSSWKSWSRQRITEEEGAGESIFTEPEPTTVATTSRSLPPIERKPIIKTNNNNNSSNSNKNMNRVDEEPMHVDAAEKVYDTMKGVWGWGKSVIIFSPFLGLAETVAGKMVDMVGGTTLDGLDSGLTGKLQELDDNIFNPAIHLVVTTVMGAAHQTTEGFVKPILFVVLKPLDYLIKPKPEKNSNEENDEPSPESAAPPAVES